MPTKSELQAALNACKADNAKLKTDLANCKAALADCQAGHVEPDPVPPPATTPWRPYADTSVWNRGDARLLVPSPNSAKLVAQMQADHTVGDQRLLLNDPWTHPVYWASDGDPLCTITLTENWGTTTQGEQIHVPAYAKPAPVDPNGDGHLTVIQPDSMAYDFYEATVTAGKVTARFGGKSPIGGSPLGGRSTALGHGLAAGLITGEELTAGVVRHALFAVTEYTNGQKLNGAWSTGRTAQANGRDPSLYPAMGQRFRLDYTDAELDALPGPDWQKAITRALATYGLVIGDTGGGLFKPESPLPYTQRGLTAPLTALADKLGLSYFQVAIDWSRMRALA